MQLIKDVFKRVIHHFQAIVRIKKSPHEIALGFAVGTFLVLLPTPGISFLLALLVLFLFPRINKFTLLGAFIVWNPLLSIPLAGAGYRIGNLLFAGEPVMRFRIVLLNTIYHYTLRYAVGNTILAMILASVSYSGMRVIVWLFQRKVFKQDR